MPENDKGIQTSQRIDVNEHTRSEAREEAAFRAYAFVCNHGLWVNLKDAGLVPSLENSINQLQELYQKKYLDEAPSYEFEHCLGRRVGVRLRMRRCERVWARYRKDAG